MHPETDHALLPTTCFACPHHTIQHHPRTRSRTSDRRSTRRPTTADRVLLKRCFFRRREDGDTLNTLLWPRARRGSTGRRAEVPSEDIAVTMPNEPHRQARELGTGGVRTSLRRQSLGRKGTQRRRRAWSRVRLNNPRWLRSSPPPESPSHRHGDDEPTGDRGGLS